jgi:superoxide reductase
MKTKLEQIYRCPTCGHIIAIIHPGEGTLVCCGKPMELLIKKINEAGLNEKHVPVIEKTADGVRVQVGSVLHPMEPMHYIEWIELLVDGRSCLQFLQPGQAPVAEFKTEGKNISARIYCNLHGLWEKA